MGNATSPVDFLNAQSWGTIKLLSEMEEFRNLDRDIEGSAKRWKKLVESEAPEKEKLPQEWKNKNALQKLCIMRALRPDRMTYAVRDFVEEKLGSEYAETRGIPFEKSFEETGPQTPTFFILSPGVDPLADVEKLGKKLGFTMENKKLHNVSLGQGQEVVAEAALDLAAEKGHWVILQNIHLVAKWLMTLQNKIVKHSSGSHIDFRIYMSAEPASIPANHIIPLECTRTSTRRSITSRRTLLRCAHASPSSRRSSSRCVTSTLWCARGESSAPRVGTASILTTPVISRYR